MTRTIDAAVLAECERWIGTPYRHQASARGQGCDCLGLLRGVWRAVLGREPELPPPYSPDWGEADGGETLLEAARRHLVPAGAVEPARVLVFRWRPHLPARHVGIVAGADTFIHASEHCGVARAALVPFWRRRITGVFAFPDPSPSTPTPGN